MSISEPIIAILPGLQQRKGLLGLKVELYNLLITPQRLVFAAVSGQLMRQATIEARDQAKADGAGLMGQWGAQFAWMEMVVRRYRDATIEQILAQYPGSWTLPRADVRRITAESSEDDDSGRETHALRIDAAGGKYRFLLAGKTADEARQILGAALPGVVR